MDKLLASMTDQKIEAIQVVPDVVNENRIDSIKFITDTGLCIEISPNYDELLKYGYLEVKKSNCKIIKGKG